MPDDPILFLDPIGIARTPYETPADAPHQGFADDESASIVVHERYAEALAGLDDAVRVTVVYWATDAARDSLTNEGGVGAFARRTPNRPNPLSICPCLLLGVDGREVRVDGLDAVDGSPVLDLKPTLQGER